MMTDDLVKRLFRASIYDPHEAEYLCELAAVRIEKLEAALREIAEGYETPWSTATMSNLFAVGAILSERINIARKALEGKEC
jgi:hypothetical protein